MSKYLKEREIKEKRQMSDLNVLITTAISLAFIHTIIGVDHYVPFIALSRANDWAIKKTMFFAFLCGIGHIFSSVVLGVIGIALSSAVSLLVDIQDIRGLIATYLLIAFGFVYTIYGIRSAVKNNTHKHITAEGNTVIHSHSKHHECHAHSELNGKKSLNIFWGLFLVFILGPCEPLIPILMYPAVTQNISALIIVTSVYAIFTIATMLLMTFLGVKGIQLIKIDKLNRYAHAMAGSAVLICGLSLLLLPI